MTDPDKRLVNFYHRVSNVIHPVLGMALRGVLRLLPTRLRVYVQACIVEDSIPIYSVQTSSGPLRLFCPGHVPVNRAYRFFTKEKDTIAWLDTMTRDDVLWDVGANVGTYSLYAAMHGVSVVAFEPEPGNFWNLTRNLDINHLHRAVVALPIALSVPSEDIFSLATFGINRHQLGTAGHPGIGTNGKFGRDVICIGARDISHILHVAWPTHVKIDVDGHELSVIRGIDFEDPQLRSVLIELRRGADAEAIRATFERHGFVTRRPWSDLAARNGSATNYIFEKAR